MAVAAGAVWVVVADAAADIAVVADAAADTAVVEGAAADTAVVEGAAANTLIVAGTAASTAIAAAGTGINDVATGTIMVAFGTPTHGGSVPQQLPRHTTMDLVTAKTIMFSGVLTGTGLTIRKRIHLGVMTASTISAEAPTAKMQTV